MGTKPAADNQGCEKLTEFLLVVLVNKLFDIKFVLKKTKTLLEVLQRKT